MRGLETDKKGAKNRKARRRVVGPAERDQSKGQRETTESQS